MANATPTLTLTLAEDFGVIRRGRDDVEVCNLGGAFNHAEKCRIIDDAIIYLRATPARVVTDLMDRAARSSPYLPNTPPGRLPDFYRVIIASRYFQQYSAEAPTLRQMLTVLDLIEDARGRDDDFAMLQTATRAVLKLPLTREEQAWAAERMLAINAAADEPSREPPPVPPTSAAGGGAVAAAVAVGTGGFVVGGPVGAVVGAVLGLALGARR